MSQSGSPTSTQYGEVSFQISDECECGGVEI